MHFQITKVSQEFTKNGDEFKKITGFNVETNQESTKSVFNNLEGKWGMLEEDRIVQLKLEKKGQYWNVVDILPPELPTVPTQESPPESTKPLTITKNPQEIGMWWKELGESLRYGLIDQNRKSGKHLRNTYFKEMFRVLNIQSPEED